VRVLVTNDDGVDAPGIKVLARALHEAGHEVQVVAPASDLSGAAASIGPLHRAEPIPVAARSWRDLPGVPVIAIERPPATAVYLACLEAFGERPDAVASGINPGANTGHLVLHSGTVGAALTAQGLGVPGVALSMKWTDDEYHWETAARFADPALRWVTAPAADEPRPRVLSVNTPNVPFAEVRGLRAADLAPYGEFWVASADLREGDLRIEFQGRDEQPAPDTDVALIAQGYATVTPLWGIVAAPLKDSGRSVETSVWDAARDMHGG
jgi:5'-nucleotidase